MTESGLTTFIDNNARRPLKSVRTAIKNYFDEISFAHLNELKELKQEHKKEVADLKISIENMLRTLRNNSDERIALDMKVQMLEKQLQEKQQLLDRFLPAEKSVERYCNHCNSLQKFTTNN